MKAWWARTIWRIKEVRGDEVESVAANSTPAAFASVASTAPARMPFLVMSWEFGRLLAGL
jgi:hypothetical protein